MISLFIRVIFYDVKDTHQLTKKKKKKKTHQSKAMDGDESES